jgi:ABC-type nitrate/sulfonate/bicarbonate transport system permease component
MLPPLSDVLDRIRQDAITGDLLINTGLTLYRALAGFLISAVGGIMLGLAMSRSVSLRWFFDPIVSVGFPMPKIAFLPIVILWHGFFDASKIAIVVFDAIFPVVTATIAGIQGVERELVWSARNMGARERDVMWQILLPAALPQILTGLQVALPLCLIVAVVAEMAMGIVEIALVGYCLVKAMSMLRRRLLVWHQEAMEPSTS